MSEVRPKKNVRRLNRMATIQFLYAWEINRPEEDERALREFFSEQEEPREFFSFAEDLIWGFLENRPSVDEEIKKYSANWSFERIAKIDLAILRLAVYELLHREDIPPIVSINEAIDLTKVFSSDDSKRFVNGILDKVKGGLSRPLREAKKI